MSSVARPPNPAPEAAPAPAVAGAPPPDADPAAIELDRLRRVLGGCGDVWWDWDIRSDRCRYGERWRTLLGLSPGPAAEEPFWSARVHPTDRAAFDAALAGALARGAGLEIEVRLQRDDGEIVPVLARGGIERDEAGRARRCAGTLLDLTERKRHEAQVERLAFHDPLTDLPNRRLLADRLEQALRGRSRTGQMVAVVTLDLDEFKALNDTHGHAAGDQLLRVVAHRLVDTVRRHDTVARVGGDEYVVLLEHLGIDATVALNRAEHIARKLLTELNRPYMLDVGAHHLGASFGVALAGEPDVDGRTLLERADLALYQAKQSGRNRVRVYDPALRERAPTRVAREGRLESALRSGELALYVQAQVGADGRLWGAEGLSRWLPADGPPIAPAEFIPVAEECGLIYQIGRANVSRACAQLAAWGPSLPPGFRLSLNLTLAELLHPTVAEHLLGALAEHGVPGHRLKLELTETTLLTDDDAILARMTELAGHGVGFAIDEFGSGYCSLTQLARLPITELKISRTYVGRLGRDEVAEAVIRAVVAIGTAFGLQVVAEGVETDDQLARLKALGCRAFQGFLFARPQAPPADPGALVQGAGT